MNERPNEPALSNFGLAERDSLSTRNKLEEIVDVLKTRFSDYSDEAPSLEPLSSALDLDALRQIFTFACRAPSFDKFCEELDALWASRDAQTQSVDEELRRELATAQLFNNFIVKILEQRRRIGASFLRRYVEKISPKVAQEIDFDAYETEPTVHIFGAQVSRLCDLVFSIPYKDRSKGFQAVVLPMEHKSTQTRNVVFQLLTTLVLVLQYILRHKERFQRNDKKFVWPFLLLFYTGARPWKRVLNLPDLFATPDAALDRRWIFKLPFKFTSLFARSRRRSKPDPWLDAFLQLTKAAEKIVSQKDATAEDWRKAWNDALEILEGQIDASNEEESDIFSDFYIFVSKVAIRQGWEPPTHEEITHNLEKLGGDGMTFKIDSIYDIGRYNGWKEGKKEGKQEGDQSRLRDMVKQCVTLRFPRITQKSIDSIVSISDSNILESIFKIACTSESLDNFQRDVRGMAPVN